MSLVSEAMPIQEEDETNVLLALFSALDSVLQLLSLRGRKGLHSVVRSDVESVTGRDLDDNRLRYVLGLVGPNVIDVRWVNSGQNAKLELFQCDKDGNRRAPTLEEMSQRKEDFKVALAAAQKCGQLPQFVFPERPAPPPVVNVRSMPVLSVPQIKTTPASPNGTRQQSLLERVRARERQASELRVRERQYDVIRHEIGICDDAQVVHKVLQSMFARGEGKNSAASEEEVLQALRSVSFGMQCMKPLDGLAAQEALTLLIEKSSQWFTVQAGVHNPKAKYFRRLPQSRAADALEAVQVERLNLEQKLRELCEATKRQEQEAKTAGENAGEDVCASQAGLKRLKRPLPTERANTLTQTEEHIVNANVVGKKEETLLKRPRLRKKTSVPTTDRVYIMV